MFIDPVSSTKPWYLTAASPLTRISLGVNFPAYAFENQAETEGFARMSKAAGYHVVGLPNYIVWHIDTDEKGGNLGNRKAYWLNGKYRPMLFTWSIWKRTEGGS